MKMKQRRNRPRIYWTDPVTSLSFTLKRPKTINQDCDKTKYIKKKYPQIFTKILMDFIVLEKDNTKEQCPIYEHHFCKSLIKKLLE